MILIYVKFLYMRNKFDKNEFNYLFIKIVNG